MMAMLDPRTKPNSPGKRESVWAFLSVDKNGEGVVGANISGFGWMQLVTTKESIVPGMKKAAVNLAQEYGYTIRLVRFDRAEEIETIDGPVKS